MSKTRFTVLSMQNTEFSLISLLINYCIIFHMNNCKPTFSHACINSTWFYLWTQAPTVGVGTYTPWIRGDYYNSSSRLQ